MSALSINHSGKKIYVKYIIVFFIVSLLLFLYSSIRKKQVKSEVSKYLLTEYNEDMEITYIGYDFKDSSYNLSVKAYNGINFKIHYSKRYGISESYPYFVSVWEQEIANDISVKCSELYNTYINCRATDTIYDYNSKVKDDVRKLYEKNGYPPSIQAYSKENVSFVLHVGLPEELSENSDKTKKICEYAFEKYNVETIYFHNGDLVEDNVYKTLKVTGAGSVQEWR